MLCRYLLSVLIVGLLCCLGPTGAHANDLSSDIQDIRYQMTAIEHSDLDKDKKEQAYKALTQRTDALIKQYPDDALTYTWKGITLSGYVKYARSLSMAKESRDYLQQAVKMNNDVADGAALYVLGILYSRVPGWPLSYGSNKKAEEYFQRALKVSSNLDTNYRYGEFLLNEKDDPKLALEYLKTALNFKDREGRKEDALKKKDIKALIAEAENYKDDTESWMDR